MARPRAAEQPRGRSKTAAAEELSRGIEKLRELSAQIDDLSREGFPYRDAVRARTELSLRETIRRIFGEKSPEYQTHKAHKLRTANKAEAAQSTGLLKDLITKLESQKAELLGLKPPAPTDPPPPKRPALPPVPPTQPAPTPAPSTSPGPAPIAPMTVSVAMTTNLTSTTQTVIPTVITTPAAPIGDVNRPSPLPAQDPSLNRTPQPATPLSPVRVETQPADSKPAAAETRPPDPVTAPSPVVASTAQPIAQAAASTEHANPTNPGIKAAPLPAADSPQTLAPAASLPLDPKPVAPLPPSVTPVQTTSDLTQVVPVAPAAVPAETLPPIKPIPAAAVQERLSASGSHAVKTGTGQIPHPTAPSVAPMAPVSPTALDATVVLSRPGPPNHPKPQDLAPPAKDRPTPTATSTEMNRATPLTEDESHHLLRRLCARFHLVARQLRLRNEYRPTLEIEDEQDLQDLFYALLRLQFDEVGLEEWAPPYANGTRRTSYLLDREKTLIVVKKTRSGLNARAMGEQLKADQDHFAGRGEGRTLFCFIYDPEGRVGNPRGLEADLTSVSDSLSVEVIVAPK